MGESQEVAIKTVLSAILVMQIALVVTLGITAMLDRGEKDTLAFSPTGFKFRESWLGGPTWSGMTAKRLVSSGVALPPLTWRLLFLTVGSFILLVSSADSPTQASPLLGEWPLRMQSATSIYCVFFLDFLIVSWLIRSTGGAKVSPYTGVLFMLPALAIFLRLPTPMFMGFAVLAAVLYLALLRQHQASIYERSTGATAFMNVACLVISMYTGYMTRPVAIVGG